VQIGRSASGRKKVRAQLSGCKSDKIREVELMVLMKREVGGRDLPHSLTLDQFLEEPSAERDF
jgi:hypothetical protein